jgi:hypothetical protein
MASVVAASGMLKNDFEAMEMQNLRISLAEMERSQGVQKDRSARPQQLQ